MMKNLPHSCQGRVYSSTLGARCVYRGERQRHYDGRRIIGEGVLNAVWSGAATLWLWVSDIDSRSSDRCNVTAVGKSSMLCCSSTAVDTSPVICAWHLYFK